MVSSGRHTDRAALVWKLSVSTETAEIDVVYHLGAGELPGAAEREPFLWIFLLLAVSDDLAKQAVSGPGARSPRRGLLGSPCFP